MTEALRPLLLTPREAAKQLSISDRTLFSLRKRGVVRGVQVGRSVRYTLADLQAYIESHRDADPSPVAAEQLHERV